MIHVLGDSRNSRIGRPLLWLGLFAGCVLLSSFTAAEVAAGVQSPDGAALYAASCASCHQADGSGIEGTFPPLRGNLNAADPSYVADVIQNGVEGPIDVNGVVYDSVMPPVAALEGADLDAVVAFVVDIAVSSTPTPTTTPPAEPDAEPFVPDDGRGHDLFLGADRLENGGAACAACHTAGEVGNLGGPGLGPDLTTSFETLGGAAGLTGWLTNPPSETMAPIFADDPLTENEIADLVAFLSTTPADGPEDRSVDGLTVAGIGGAVVLFAGLALGWRGTRQTYAERLRSKR
ncbi:MAG: c-type cytochrome [Acidimicrobiales bacterium]